MSDDQPTIYQALANVMIDVDHVRKDDTNRQGGYSFRGIDAVVNAVGPALRKHGVIVVPQVVSYDYGEIAVGKNRTPMGHARVVVSYTFYGPAGDSIGTSTPGEAFDSGDKATPKAMSVAFRTALLQALALPTDEQDADAQTYTRAPRSHPNSDRDDAEADGVNPDTGEVRMISRGQLINLKALESQLGKGGKDETEEARAERMKFYWWASGEVVDSAKKLTQRGADAVISELQKRVPADA